jgi:hypothetical protein
MKKYKGYREQTQECKKTKVQFEVPCIRCGQINLICHRYKAYCSSALCRDERMTNQQKAEFYAKRLDDDIEKSYKKL